MSKFSRQCKKIFGRKIYNGIAKPIFHSLVAATTLSVICPILAPMSFL